MGGPFCMERGASATDIHLLDKNFDLICTIDQFETLIWDRKYYECGRFELHAENEYFEAFRNARHVFVKGFDETGMVESYGHQTSDQSAYIKGRFMECELDAYVIHTVQNLSGTPPAIIKRLADTFVTRSPYLTTAPAAPMGTSIQLQTTGDNLMEKCYDIARTQGMSIRVAFDYLTNRAQLVTWRGLDRRSGQSVNSLAVFSDNRDNVTSSTYVNAWGDYRNYAYVAGEGEGMDRVIVPVDRTNGEELRELWVDARDLQQGGLSTSEYRDQLRQRGDEKLAKYPKIETAEVKVKSHSKLRYREDFDLGDFCEYEDQDLGILVEQRITEIIETFENNVQSIDIVFGESECTIKQLVERSV